MTKGEQARCAPGLVERYGARAVDALHDILAFADEAAALVAPGRARYLESRLLQLASEALLQKIGEAANRLPEQFRLDHPDVPWRAMRGMRNVLTHEYQVIDHVIVWEAVSRDVPASAAQIRRILEA